MNSVVWLEIVIEGRLGLDWNGLENKKIGIEDSQGSRKRCSMQAPLGVRSPTEESVLENL